MANYTISSTNLRHESNEWIEKLARFGFIAKGVIYVLLGILAVMAAVGQGSSQQADRNGVLQLIFEQPFGRILAILLVIGVIGYAIWRFIEAIKDPYQVGSDSKGMLKRVGYFVSGLIYTGFALSIIRLLAGSGSGNSNSRQTLTAKVLQMDAGPFLVILAGVIVIIVGIVQFYRAYKTEFNKRLNTQSLSSDVKEWITRIGRIGYTARGIVWLIVGFFVVRAGMESDASEVKGSQGVFSFLEQLSYGQWILLAVAIGVVAYGIFQFVKARYYQIKLH